MSEKSIGQKRNEIVKFVGEVVERFHNELDGNNIIIIANNGQTYIEGTGEKDVIFEQLCKALLVMFDGLPDNDTRDIFFKFVISTLADGVLKLNKEEV